MIVVRCVAAVSFLVLVTSHAGAQDAAASAADGRGTITKEQFLANADRRFDRLDTNKDGVVDEAEQKAAIDAEVAKVRARMERSFARVAKSDKLTKEKARADAAGLFDRIDRDKTGKITAAQRRAFFARIARFRDQDE